MIQYRTELSLAEAAERVKHFNHHGAPRGPWAILGVPGSASAEEITAAYAGLCDGEAHRLTSPVLQVRVEAEERIRDYTAAVMVLNAD